ncbi:MAG: tRNA pseudouridine(55) synthase TruB [Blautia sp.]|nr:tRNA pseudouridine(55) synthase TruB [Lachnoclostridium sp.]MCM1210253.1 tRNA pseudouridine(55) synthase TruB [Blautia sp.]
MYHGIINIYKEAGYTSHDVVAKLRGILGQKKIGHTGTLDPDAVGVLPVCLGNGCRLCDMLNDTSKEYRAKLRLGVTTDTQDMSGTVLMQKEVFVTEKEVADTAYTFLGSYEQVPPMYSALKVNGKKLYELAREGKVIERKARTVQIEALDILQMELPLVEMRVVCSKGTYIRTLCNDIGEKLGCGGAMESLLRSRVGSFRVEDALLLSDVEKLSKEGGLQDFIIPVEKMFSDLAENRVKSTYQKQLQNGNQLAPKMLCIRQDMEDNKRLRIYNEQGVFYGIYRYEKNTDLLYPVKMFLPE